VSSKNIYFLCGLPRSGNTLLGAIINQNKNVNLTANSILPGIIYDLHFNKNSENYKNFPDEKSLNNIILNIFGNYFCDWNANNIIVRGPWGTPTNLLLLKQIIKKPKFIILYRPVLECLASFIKIEKPANIESRCYQLMHYDGMIGKNLWSIKNIIKEKENFILINYKDFVKNTKEQLLKIYNFLNIDFFDHKLERFDQFKVNNISYLDSVLAYPLHNIKTNKIELDNYSVADYLPSDIIQKYSNLDV
jgi:sulfotransferase